MSSIFEQVRERVTMLDAITFLGLTVKQESPGQYRAKCPACKGSEKRDLSINAEKGFRCFRGDKKGNDATALVAHVRGISQTDAAKELAEHFISAARASPSPAPKEGVENAAPTTESDVLEMLGMSPYVAGELGLNHQEGRVGFYLRYPSGDTAGILWLAKSEALPLVTWEPTTGVMPATSPAEGLRKLWRVHNGGAK